MILLATYRPLCSEQAAIEYVRGTAGGLGGLAMELDIDRDVFSLNWNQSGVNLILEVRISVGARRRRRGMWKRCISCSQRWLARARHVSDHRKSMECDPGGNE